jgi:hypothetical protein
VLTSDLANYQSTSAVSWSGTDVGWDATGTTTAWSDLASSNPFRCVGRATAPTPNAARPAGAFVGVGGLAIDAADRVSTSWAPANAACRGAGGHLAYSTELAALVQQGLVPSTAAGAPFWIWTADEEGYETSSGHFTVGALRWTPTQFRFYYSSGDASWFYKDDAGALSHAYRCLYYPVDATVATPTCNQGCYTLSLGGGAKVWFDSQDRTPTTFIGALGICRNLGAHLASGRDIVDAVPAGLQNGTAAWLHTADAVVGTLGPLKVMIKKWTGTDPDFTDQYNTYITWGAFADSRPYRCVWTNELR